MYDFEKISDLCKQEKWLIEKIAHLRYISSPSLTGKIGKTGHRESYIEKIAIKRAELSEELEEIQSKIDELRNPLLEDTKKMEPGINRVIAKCHFGYGISIREIAKALKYTEAYVFRCMKDTVLILQRLEDERKER